MINALVQEELQELENENKEMCRLSEITGVNWCFRKIRALNAKVNENNRIADEEVQRIENWRKKENDVAESSIAYFEGLLKEYYKDLKAEDPKAKLSTPYGKISSRKLQPKYVYDENVAIAWLEENDKEALVKVKKSVDKTAFKKKFKDGIDSDTGEILDFVQVIPQEDSITIKVD